jgi:predicted RNA binding protein YcfA (HicA-like mRNA interferase family)
MNPSVLASLLEFAELALEARVSQVDKLIRRLLSGQSDASFTVAELVRILRYLGFEERQKGSHRFFTRADVRQPINLQSQAGRAKPYQVRQISRVIRDLGLWRDTDAEV